MMSASVDTIYALLDDERMFAYANDVFDVVAYARKPLPDASSLNPYACAAIRQYVVNLLVPDTDVMTS